MKKLGVLRALAMVQLLDESVGVVLERKKNLDGKFD